MNDLFVNRRRLFLTLLSLAACLVFLFSYADRTLILTRKDYSGQRVALRDFPYPYRAMAALVNDCDNLTPRAFERYHRFLNTRGQTIYGEGLGLDVSDSFFAYTAAPDYSRVMTYFSGLDPDSEKDARRILRFYNAGWIDAVHALGDFSQSAGAASTGGVFTRELAVRAFDAFSRAGIYPAVWTDHGNEGNTQNFGSYGPFQSSRYKRGDDIYDAGSYHTDAAIGGGIKYVWDSDYCSRFGFDFPLTAKTLRDGRKVWAFSRFTGGGNKAGNGGGGANAYIGGGDGNPGKYGDGGSGGNEGVGGKNSDEIAETAANKNATARTNAYAGANAYAGGSGGRVWDWYPDRLRYEITPGRLAELAEKRQYGLFAQHLGFYGEDYVFEPEDVAALRLLSEYQYGRGAVLVAGSARLLEYAAARRFACYRASRSRAGDCIEIDIVSIDDPLFPDSAPSISRLRGLTFYCDDPESVRLSVNGTRVAESETVRNAPDETGRPSISVRWHPADYTDYTIYG